MIILIISTSFRITFLWYSQTFLTVHNISSSLYDIFKLFRGVFPKFPHNFNNSSQCFRNIGHHSTPFSHGGDPTEFPRSSHGVFTPVWTMLFLGKQRFLWFHGDFHIGVKIGVKMFTKCSQRHRFSQYFILFSYYSDDMFSLLHDVFTISRSSSTPFRNISTGSVHNHHILS